MRLLMCESVFVDISIGLSYLWKWKSLVIFGADRIFMNTIFTRPQGAIGSQFVASLMLVFALLSIAGAQSFTDRSDNLLSNTNFHSGVAMGVTDMNGDGLDDIIRLSGASNLFIEYQGAPNATFTTLNYGDLGSGSEWSLCIGDVDGNGFNDVVAGGAYNNLKLLRANANGTNYTRTILPSSNIFLQGSNLVDINNDGFLDVYGCHDDGESRNYRNLGNGNFVFDNSLIDTTLPGSNEMNAGNYASIWTDYDNDGDLDMYLSKCRLGVNNFNDQRRINRLFQNDGNNNFTEVGAAAGLRIGDQTWATDFADYDNDGDMDCFVMNHYTASYMMENNGDGTFTDVTSTSGLTANDLDLFGIQSAFRDFDNDGFVDLVIAGSAQRLFKNNGDGTFTRLPNPFNNNAMESFAIGDLNSDGYLDIYAGYARIFNSPTNIEDVVFINDGGSNNFFSVLLEGTDSNINGVGARLELHGDWGVQYREVRSGESYGIMNSLRQHFGIGSATAISKLVVKWPSGTVDELLNPSINSLITFEEGSSPILPPTLLGDCDLNGVVNFFDITPFIDILSDETFLLEADCNEDGTVDFFDITPFIDILSEQE